MKLINLAGVQTCDDIIKKELELAEIELVSVGKRERSEVPSEYIGKCNNFILSRAWYYWVVTGYMPLKYAKEIYANFKDLNIRAAGHCCNPPPEEWCECKDYFKKCKTDFEKFYNNEISYEECDKRLKEIRAQGDQFVTCYHIDTQEGLNKFAEIVKKNNIIG